MKLAFVRKADTRIEEAGLSDIIKKAKEDAQEKNREKAFAKSQQDADTLNKYEASSEAKNCAGYIQRYIRQMPGMSSISCRGANSNIYIDSLGDVLCQAKIIPGEAESASPVLQFAGLGGIYDTEHSTPIIAPNEKGDASGSDETDTIKFAVTPNDIATQLYKLIPKISKEGSKPILVLHEAVINEYGPISTLIANALGDREKKKAEKIKASREEEQKIAAEKKRGRAISDTLPFAKELFNAAAKILQQRGLDASVEVNPNVGAFLVVKNKNKCIFDISFMSNPKLGTLRKNFLTQAKITDALGNELPTGNVYKAAVYVVAAFNPSGANTFMRELVDVDLLDDPKKKVPDKEGKTSDNPGASDADVATKQTSSSQDVSNTGETATRAENNVNTEDTTAPEQTTSSSNTDDLRPSKREQSAEKPILTAIDQATAILKTLAKLGIDVQGFFQKVPSSDGTLKTKYNNKFSALVNALPTILDTAGAVANAVTNKNSLDNSTDNSN